jgi:alkanesulfonate monooxygenase SsuD/methylene tetrahydromethanopterin reductase-like flavin-dependent oxidoreductase (luciferase family)
MMSRTVKQAGVKMTYHGSFGVHFAIHQPHYVDYAAGDLLALAEHASANGFAHVWINDNFKARHTYSLLAAMAARVPLGLGTLVTYPYARNPMDMATAFGTIGELLNGRELTVGISTGAWAIQGALVEQPAPVQSVREAILLSRRLLAGEEVLFHNYPALSRYFHIKPDAKFRLQFRPERPVTFWVPPKGPKMLRLAAEACDGVLFNTYTRYAALPFIRDGTLERTLREMEQMRAAAGNKAPLRRILKLDVSLDEDGDAARSFARNYVSFNAAQDADKYRAFGLPGDQLDALQARYRKGAEISEAAPLVGRELIDWVVLAGTPAEVADRFAEYVECAGRLGFEQVIVAVPLGPDPRKAIELASRNLVARVKG